MKHSMIRGLVLAIAVILIFLSSFYFESYKAGGPFILKPLGELVHGSLFLLSGISVLFDTFYLYRQGLVKRKHRLFDIPFMLSIFFVFTSIVALIDGIRDLITLLN